MTIGSNLLYHATLSSTNEEASRLLRSEEPPEGTVVYTDFQSAGKGQPGNKWESEKGKNLLFSIILYPITISPTDQFLISMTISLGICDFIDKYCRDVRIKWPNDIYVKDDKIAGILIENSIMQSKIGSTIAGIGLNVNQENFEGIGTRPVSLRLISGKEFNLKVCLTELLHNIDKRYKELLYGDISLIRTDYISRLYRFREWSSFSCGDSVFTGRITDVLISGRIIIEEKEQGFREFSFREFNYLF